MSGHSKWSTIKRKKGVADAKRGAIFTRLARELVIASREGGSDINSNFRLRLAVDKARAENMPKDNIERAIKRGAGEDEDGTVFEEITFEGYGPHGSALMVTCVTDNRNRTVPDMRHAFTKYGGNMAELGSVAWQFERKSYFAFPASELSFEELLNSASKPARMTWWTAKKPLRSTAPGNYSRASPTALHSRRCTPRKPACA